MADEGATAATGFKDTAPGEAGLKQRLPHHRGDRRVGVVRIEDRGLRTLVFIAAEQFGQRSAFGGEAVISLVEYLGYRAPARPRGQHGLLVAGCRASRLTQAGDHLQRGDVGLHPRFGAGGHEDLGARHEIGRAQQGGVDWVGVDLRCRRRQVGAARVDPARIGGPVGRRVQRRGRVG